MKIMSRDQLSPAVILHRVLEREWIGMRMALWLAFLAQIPTGRNEAYALCLRANLIDPCHKGQKKTGIA